MSITPTDGEAIILDGAKIIPEETDGSGNTPISLGTITDDKDESGDAVYHLAEGDDAAGTDNGDFRITNNVLFYKGAAVDFESASDADKSFSIKILRYKNAEDAEAERSPQTLDSTINLQDIEEVLIVTPAPAADVPYFSVENGQILLHENIAGNGGDGTSAAPKFLATLTDGGIESSYTITYRVANNENFTILNGNELYYVGPELDFEIATQKQFALNIERIRDGDTENPQTFTHTVNLKNLNDTAPDLTAYLPLAEGATEKTEIAEYIAVGNVGGGNYAIAIDVREKDHQVTFDFRYVDDDASDFVPRVMIEAEYETANDPNSKVTKFIITTRLVTYDTIGLILDDTSNALVTATSNADALRAWNDYVKSVKYVGASTLTPAELDSLYSADNFLTGTYKGIVVERGTTGTIVDFDDNDLDGDSFTYSYNVTDTVASSGDADAFNINSDGELSFIIPPTADKTYDITVTISDGETPPISQKFRIVVVENVRETSNNPNIAPTAAESVPSAEEGVAEATPEAEAAKPSIGRRILDYLFGSQEEHRQMQNQQIENMFGDTLDDLNPQDPDIL